MKYCLMFALVLTACKKSSPHTGELDVEVINSITGDPMENYPGGAQVYIYTSTANFGNANDAFESAPVNNNGTAKFPNIPVRQYWFFVQAKCGTNSGSDSATIGPIVGGTTNGITTVYTPQAGCLP